MSALPHPNLRISPTHARLCNGGEKGGGGASSSDITQIEADTLYTKVHIASVLNYLNLECQREAGDVASLQSYRLLCTALVNACSQATEYMIFQKLSYVWLGCVALCARGAFVHEAGEVAWPLLKDSAPRASFLPLDTPTTFANRARRMTARKVSAARQL